MIRHCRHYDAATADAIAIAMLILALPIFAASLCRAFFDAAAML